MATDYGQQAADRSLKLIERRLKKIYQASYDELKDELDRFLKKYKKQDEKKRQQVLSGEISAEDYARWQRGQVFIGKQWKAKVDHASEILLHANQEAMNIVNGEKINVFAENANFHAYEVEKKANLDIGFGIYNGDSVARLIKEQPELLPRKVVNGKKDKAWNRVNISNAIAQSIIQGDDIPTIAKRIAEKTSSTNMKAMTRYARTAMAGAQSAGRLETMSRAQGMGIRVQKKWRAVLDSRTRDSHQMLDGQVQELDKPFQSMFGEIRYPGDPTAHPGDVYNCRCGIIGVYPDFSDLEGIGYDDQHMRRDNETKQVIGDMTYKEWLRMKGR